MLSNIRTKIRSLIEDLTKSDFETFTYTNSSDFILAESNIVSIVEVSKNGSALGSGEYSYNSSTNELEIIASLSSGDIIIVKYDYYKYSDTELNEFARASLVWISIYSHESETDYEIEDTNIYPTPSNKTMDLISLIASILIKPDWSDYRLPNLTVRYPRTMAKEERIEKLVTRFNSGIGFSDVLIF